MVRAVAAAALSSPETPFVVTETVASPASTVLLLDPCTEGEAQAKVILASPALALVLVVGACAASETEAVVAAEPVAPNGSPAVSDALAEPMVPVVLPEAGKAAIEALDAVGVVVVL